MAWLKVDQSLPSHRKILRASDELDISVPQMIGHVVTFWLWALSSASDGDLTDITPGMIARVSGWTGSAQVFFDTLVSSGFLESGNEGLRIRNWEQYGGKIVQDQEKDAERKRKDRRQKKDEQRTSEGQPEQEGKDIRRTSEGHPEDIRCTSGVDKIRIDKIDKIRQDKTYTCIDDDSSPSKTEYDNRLLEAFQKFWEIYPRKINKKAAEKAWMALFRSAPKSTHADLMRGVALHIDDYKEDIEERGTEERFIKHPATWLRAVDFSEPPVRGAV